MRSILLLLLSCACTSGWCTDRLLLPAAVDGKPARFCFDTGSDHLVVFSNAARRLGLNIIKLPSKLRQPTGKVALGETEECDLTLNGTRIRTTLSVIESSSEIPWDIDGFAGWPTLSSNIISIEAQTMQVSFLDSVPNEAATWSQVPIITNFSILALQFSASNKSNDVVLVDTGDPSGVALAPPEWERWRASHANVPITIESAFDLAGGWSIRKEAWATDLSLGWIKLTDLLVLEAYSTSLEIGGPRYYATLGLTALKRLDLILDAKSAVAYIRPKLTKAAPSGYNRLGAVFIPKDNQMKPEAHVMIGSPAYEAGVRDGDILQTLTITNLVFSPPDYASIAAAFRSPAGTRIRLQLIRAGRRFSVSADLRELLRQ